MHATSKHEVIHIAAKQGPMPRSAPELLAEPELLGRRVNISHKNDLCLGPGDSGIWKGPTQQP